MWSSHVLRQGAPAPVPVALHEVAAALKEPGFLWIDLSDPTPEEAGILNDPFQFHPLAIEDAAGQNLTPPKIDDFRTYLFVIAQALQANSTADKLEIVEVGLFLGPNYLVTVHAGRVPAIELTHASWLDPRTPTSAHSDSLAYLILDRIVDEFVPIVDALAEQVEKLEDDVLDQGPAQVSRVITDTRRTVGRLQRLLSPQREVAYRLSRPEWPLIQEKNFIYFRDVYDHLVRMEMGLEGLYQRTDLALQIHLGAVANRTNEVVKILSLVGTIFLPLTFLVGVYGMNFRYMPELNWRYGYFVVWGLNVAITVGMLVYFRSRRWL